MKVDGRGYVPTINALLTPNPMTASEWNLVPSWSCGIGARRTKDMRARLTCQFVRALRRRALINDHIISRDAQHQLAICWEAHCDREQIPGLVIYLGGTVTLRMPSGFFLPPTGQDTLHKLLRGARRPYGQYTISHAKGARAQIRPLDAKLLAAQILDIVEEYQQPDEIDPTGFRFHPESD